MLPIQKLYLCQNSRLHFCVYILGLYAAASDLKTEWAVIKAVSDFADGSKSSTEPWQPFSSAMAASVVYNMFKYPVLIQHWPHYNAEDMKGSYSLYPNETRIFKYTL